MEINFCSLSSGSSGNCYYLGNGPRGLLIDAGISATSVRKFLGRMDIPIQSIAGILLTHNHIDHIKGLEVLTRRNSIPAFTTRKIWKSILTPYNTISKDCIREIHIRKGFRLAGFEIEAFPVSHDAPETVGYHISAGDQKITIATDLGHICHNAAPYIKAANLLVIESNYDDEMLVNGRYPQFLKARIKSDHGHLGNHQASSFLAEIMNENLHHICLAHLSRNNNSPEQALLTLRETFTGKGIVLNGRQQIMVLNRDVPSEMIRIEDSTY